MRPNDRNHGSLRMLLIFALLVANIFAAVLQHGVEALPAERRIAPEAVAPAAEDAASKRLAFAPPNGPEDSASSSLQP